MNIFRQTYNKIRRNKSSLIISAINAVVLFLLCYFVDNLPYSFVGDATLGQHFEQLKQYFQSPKEDIPEDLLLVNVAYDRELADVTDEFGLPKGNIDITDRKKLYDFLTKLQKVDYKYIILDVSFSEEYRTENDSALYSVISQVENIVISKSENFRLADSILADKARYSDYSTHISESNFVKYEYIRNGEPTLPYQMYLDLYGDAVHSFFGFYSFNGRLANKSIVLRHPIKLWNKLKADSASGDFAQQQYYNLGSDILDTGIDVISLAENKIVVIGDFSENDMHDTYLGKISGPIININAFYGLVNDDLSIPYSEIVFLLLLYFTISLWIIKGISLSDPIPYLRRIKSKTFDFIISFIGLSTVLTIIATFLYIAFGLDINILIPSLYFSILGIIIKYKHNLNPR